MSGTGKRWSRFAGSFSGGLVATAVLIPGLGAVFVTILYVYRRGKADSGWISGSEAFIIGTACAIFLWLVIAFAFRRRLATPAHANTAVYEQLREHYDLTLSRYECISRSPADVSKIAACNEARQQLERCKKELDPAESDSTTGMSWVLATGYVALWRRIHRAQEALLLAEPRCDVVGAALFDMVRLKDCAIPGNEQLIEQLQAAVGVLGPGALDYVTTESTGSQRRAPAPGPSPARTTLPGPPRPPAADPPPPAVPDPPTPTPTPTPEAEGPPAQDGPPAIDISEDCHARMVVRNISRVINQFRDDRREGLIRARNNLYRTVFVTALVTYLLFGLALLREVDELSVVAMASFYLVGALLGLFRQLTQVSSTDTIKEADYGLSSARLAHTPVFSGLAGVGGVVLVAVLGAVIPADQPNIPTLREVFDLGNNQFGLIAAAVFGLTPNLLSQRLEKQAEQYKDDLQSTDASGAVSTPAGKS